MGNAMVLTWVNRREMLKRGARMLEAYHRGKIEYADLNLWYEKKQPRYVRFSWKWNGQPTNLLKMKKRFWNDAEKYMITHRYGWQLGEFN